VIKPKYPKYAGNALRELIDAHARNAPRAELMRLEARVKAVSRPETPAKFRAAMERHIARALGRNIQTEHKARDVVAMNLDSELRERLERSWESAPS
jgi:hypothetical protein